MLYQKRESYWNLHLEEIEFQKKYSNHSILYELSMFLEKFYNFVQYILLATYICCSVFPVLTSAIQKEFILPFGVVLPFINENSFFGYFINYIYQNISLVLIFTGYNSYVRLIFKHSEHICTSFAVLKNILDELDELSKGDEFVEKKSSSRMIDVIELHQHCIR